MQFLSFLDVIASDGNEVLWLNALPSKVQKLYLRGQLDKETFKALGQNLYELGLNLSQLIEDPLPSLSRLTNLAELYLNKAYRGKKLAFLKEWFPNLKTFLIWTS
jgi:disease resistance protein RPM1